MNDVSIKFIIYSSISDKPYNFTNKNPDLKGQYDQAEIVSDLFKDQKNGFFIEAGAYDGEVFSNSLYYEVTHGWKGLLVEPNPDALKDLVNNLQCPMVTDHFTVLIFLATH